MDLHSITYNPVWYKKNPIDSSWKVSATSSAYVPPVNLTPKPLLDMEVVPELHSPGIIIHVADSYLISQQTLDNISSSANPHYDYQNNGGITISGSTTVIGQTIPIVKVDLSGLGEMSQKRNQLGNFAAVADVVYSHQTPTIKGIPKGIIQQLNYTLVQEDERPSDKFAIWDLGLEGDYSITTLKIETQQGDKILDKQKLKKFLTGVADRLAILRKDFNMIKSIYYNGNKPTTNTRTIDFDRQAQSEDPNELEDKQNKQVVFKQSQIQKVESTPVSQAADAGTTPTSGSTSTQPTTSGITGAQLVTTPSLSGGITQSVSQMQGYVAGQAQSTAQQQMTKR